MMFWSYRILLVVVVTSPDVKHSLNPRKYYTREIANQDCTVAVFKKVLLSARNYTSLCVSI